MARYALAGLVVTVLAAACSPTVPRPDPTSQVAGRSDAPNAPDLTADPGPSPIVDPAPTGAPLETLGPDLVSAIVPGSVDRTSLDVSATYRVNAAITVRTGALDVTTRIVATNNSGAGIDRLELNTIAARLGGIRVTSATVDDLPVRVTVADQTLLVPLGGVLPAGATTTLTIAYRATLRSGRTDGDWMFTRSGGTLALYRWIPWVSRALPFARPNNGEPFVTPSSPRVDIELLTDAPMVLAAPTTEVDEYVAGTGNAWSLTVNDVRDVSVVLAPDFRMAAGEAKGVTVRAFTRPGGLSATQLLQQASDAISTEAGLLGVPFPLTSLTVVETPGGVGLESPGLIWVPDSLDLRNRTYAVYQSTAHQWFYGLVGNDQRTEPFADEAPADLLARTSLGTLRATRCSQAPLDRTIAGYSRTCYYEVVLVQGGRLLDDVRRRMGTEKFWAAMASYLQSNRLRLGGTRQLLEALRAASPVDLLPLIRPRFPTLY